MPRLTLSAVLLAALSMLSVVLVACSDGEGTTTPILPTASITLTASPEPTQQPVQTAAPDQDGARRTGDPGLDAIIEAVEARDMTALAPLVEYATVGCTTAQGLGGPPKCEEGQAEGEEVRMFPVASCEGAWTRFGVQAVGQFVHETDGLWAVAGVNQYWPSTDGWRVPDTFLFFHSIQGEAGDTGVYLEVADGRIVRANWICGGGLDGLLGVEALELEVTAGPWDEPVEAAPVAAPSTGVEAVDGILTAVANYDWLALRNSALAAMEDLPSVGCDEPPLVGPGAGPECDTRKGEVAGDAIPVFPVAYCEGDLVRDPSDTVRAVLDQVPSLYGVVEAPSEPSPSDLYRHGAYWIVYELRGGPDGISSAVRLHVTEEGHLTVIWFGCRPPADEFVQWEQQPLPAVPLRGE